MRRLKFLFVLLALVVFATGCGKKDERGQINGRRGRGGTEMDQRHNQGGAGGSGGRYDPAPGHTWGEITGSPQDEFQEVVEWLVSATLDPEELGTVSGRAGGDTGIVFWGDVNLKSGRLNPNGSNRADISSDSEIRIVIWDSYAGEKDQDGNLIPEYPIHIDGHARGEIDGNYADITFEDEYGWVRFTGTFNSSEFTGEVEFQNHTYWNGLRDGETEGAWGTFERFRVKTCGFFNCQ